ncbi:MAG: DUF4157 domain-containing protein [Deltaproteobacteria bacterium]|nr:DUF4157 domain-containing protein [Deltaproteobacteria bacterium]
MAETETNNPDLGKRTLVAEFGYVQHKAAERAPAALQGPVDTAMWDAIDNAEFPAGGTAAAFRGLAQSIGAVQRSLAAEYESSIQRRGGADERAGDVHYAAAHGISGSSGPLPFLAQIQRSFGAHDVSQVKAHTDATAAAGAKAMGAEAYATGDHVVFAGAPSLHTAAHEAAHTVQQRAGVQLKGGIGEVGDAYEQHADAVADRVVQGKSAEDLLDAFAPRSTSGSAVQCKEDRELVEPIRKPSKPKPGDHKHIAPLPERIDVGTQVVDSHHTFHVAELRNLNPEKFLVTARINGDPQFVSMVQPEVVQPQATKALAVMFYPRRPGAFSADLVVTIRGNLDRTVDYGHILEEQRRGAEYDLSALEQTESQVIKLVGNARPLDELPAREDRPTLTSGAKPTNTVRESGFEGYKDAAGDAAADIAAQQLRAIESVHNAIYKYTPIAETKSFWATLAELAISMGMGFITQSLTRSLTANLSPNPSAGRRDAAPGVAVPPEAAPSSGATPTLSEYSGRDVAAMLVAPLIAGISSGVKLNQPARTDEAAADLFTEQQKDALSESASRNRKEVTTLADKLRARHRGPEADEAMRHLAQALEGQALVAREEQYRATASQWIAGLAQTDAGTKSRPESDRAGGVEQGTVVTTAMGPMLGAGIDGTRSSNAKRGVLRLKVTIFGTREDSPFTITDAAMHGVSHAFAQHLLTIDLRTDPIPILLEVLDAHDPSGIERITRDEAGTISSSQAELLDLATGPVGSTAHAHRSARRLMDRVLGRGTLIAQGVSAIKTGDVRESPERAP